MGIGDRDADNLHRRQPWREGPGIVLKQHREEPLDRAEQGAVNHHRTLAGTVWGLVFEIEALGKLEVDLNRRHLPGPTDGIPYLHRYLRAVEGGATGVQHEVQPLLGGGLAQCLGRLGPFGVATHELVGVLGGQFQIEVGQTIVTQQIEDESEQAVQLAGHLL